MTRAHPVWKLGARALGARASRGRSRSRAVELALAAATVVSCASSAPPEPPVKLQWPEPPEMTRIEHVSLITSSSDLEGPADFGERLSRALGIEAGPRGRGFVHPADVEVTPDGGVVYVSDFAQGLVHILDRERGETRYLGSKQPLARPFGLALDSERNLYVVEQAKQQIQVFDPSGRPLRVIRHEKLIRPVDLAIDEERGRLYVADPSHQNSKEHFVRIFDLDGAYLGDLGEGRGVAEGKLLFPTYVTVGPEGQIFVADTMNSRVSVFDAEGEFVRAIGRRGDGPGFFDKPKGIALDSFGNVYVVDSSWSNVQIFGPMGHVLLFFGGRGGYPGQLRNPTGIAIAEQTNMIFVNDYLNRRICVYKLVNTEPGEGIPEDAGEEVAAP